MARQVLTESILLTSIGGVAGVLLAMAGIRALIAWGPSDIPRLNSVTLDGAVLAFTFAVSLITGVLAGLLPAFQAARVDQREALQEGTRGSVGSRRGRLRNILIVSEIALAFVLTVGTSLLALSLVRVLKVNPGFQTHNLYTANFSLIGKKYADNNVVIEFSRQAIDRVRNIPGVESVALTSTLPLSGSSDRDGFIIQDRLMKDSDSPSVDSYWVTADYFRTMQIPLIRGRLFTAADEAVSATAPVAIISATTARQMWPSEDPLGKKIQLGGREEKNPWATIVGIVPDIRQYGLDADATAEAYWLSLSRPSNFVVRSSVPTASLTRGIGDQLASLDKNVPVYEDASMEDLLAKTLSQRKFVAALVGGFGLLALMLSGIGIYGVMAYHVGQRTGEIGIRMALGATPNSILGIVANDGVRVAFAGSLFGAALAFAVTRFLTSQLYHVRPTDPVAYIISIAVIAADIFLACYIPARRAAHVDPMVALRHE